MVKTGRARAVPLTLLLCAVVTTGSTALATSVAAAGPLEEVVGSVGEIVGAPVKEVTETATPAAQEVTETVAPPAQEVTETAASASKQVAETATRPTEGAAEAVQAPARQAAATVASSTAATSARVRSAVPSHAAADPAGSSSVAGASGLGAGLGEIPAATQGAGKLVGPGSHAAGSGQPPVVAEAANGDNAPGNGGVNPGREGDAFSAISRDGSIRVPLPKWMAYVWPAIALTGSSPADLLDRWVQAGARLALGAATGAVDRFGVAGVHASHDDRSAAPDSSSPFSSIPATLGHALSPAVPTPALAYLCLLALAAIAVFIAVRREIVVGRREGRGR